MGSRESVAGPCKTQRKILMNTLSKRACLLAGGIAVVLAGSALYLNFQSRAARSPDTSCKTQSLSGQSASTMAMAPGETSTML